MIFSCNLHANDENDFKSLFISYLVLSVYGQWWRSMRERGQREHSDLQRRMSKAVDEDGPVERHWNGTARVKLELQFELDCNDMFL